MEPKVFGGEVGGVFGGGGDGVLLGVGLVGEMSSVLEDPALFLVVPLGAVGDDASGGGTPAAGDDGEFGDGFGIGGG